MSVNVLRAESSWWVERSGRATRIATHAVTTAELLADLTAVQVAAESADDTGDVRSDQPLDTWQAATRCVTRDVPARTCRSGRAGTGGSSACTTARPSTASWTPGRSRPCAPLAGRRALRLARDRAAREVHVPGAHRRSLAGPRVFLLGDAAHLTPPFIGQGLCAGLRDAANLTRKLTAVLDGRAREALLDSYEQERAPHARALIVKARTVGWAMTGGQDAAAHVRRVDLAVACRLPGATDRVLDADPPRFGDGQAVRRAGRRDQVTGGLLPQPRVVGSGREVLLDRALGAGHVVLVAGSPDDALVSAARAAGIPVVTVTPPAAPGGSDVVDAAGHLLEWFRRSRTGAVLVRPDHLVQARAPRTRGATQGAALAAHLRSWCCDLAWCPPGQRISR